MNKNNTKRILHFVPYLQAGGTEAYIMNVYRHIDRTKVQFDFVVHKKNRSFYDDEVEKLGGKIYYFSIKDDLNFIKYIYSLSKFFKEHKEYKVIHVCMPSIGFIILYIAKKMGVKVRIAHSHSASYEKNLKGYIKNITCKFMKCFSNVNLACSDYAGKYLFGRKEYEIVHNAIELSHYTFNFSKRNKYRKELGLENNIVIGHIGRLSPEKNHKFMFDVLEKLIQINDKYRLLLIGTGQLEKELKELVKNKNLQDYVIFLGSRNDVNYLLSAIDIFILPSLFEGLPTVAIEAQQNGLNCLLSTSITEEVKQTERLIMLDLNEDIWVENIEKIQKDLDVKMRPLFDNSKLLDNYDVNIESKKMECRYLNYYEE